jgi:hypothetical protein
LDKDSLRQWLLLRDWRAQELEYRQALKSTEQLLKLTPETFDPEGWGSRLCRPKAMGLPNSIHQLQNYVVRLQPGELILAPDGDLEVERTFERLDYFSLLERLAVRNNVQAGVDSQPIDFVAARLPFASLSAEAKADLGTTADPIWLYAGRERQALVLSLPAEGSIQLKYLPVRNLQQDERGEIRIQIGSWQDACLENLGRPAIAAACRARQDLAETMAHRHRVAQSSASHPVFQRPYRAARAIRRAPGPQNGIQSTRTIRG